MQRSKESKGASCVGIQAIVLQANERAQGPGKFVEFLNIGMM